MNRKLEKILASGRRKLDRASVPDQPADPRPRELHLELTYRCNQKCVMCDIWPRSGGERNELDRRQIEEVVGGSEILSELDLVLLTGGEPFLRADLVDLALFFLDRYPAARLMILSNFFATDLIVAKIRAILAARPGAGLCLGTSLDGLDSTHDRVRGVEGAFSAFRRTVEAVRAEFPGVSVESNFTITPGNHSQLASAYILARDAGIGFTAQFPIAWPGTPEFEWEPGRLAEVEKTVEEIMEDVYHRAPKPGGFPTPDLLSRLFYWKGLVDYQRRPRRVFPACPASRRYVMLSPAGDLYFCPKLKNMVVGNVLESPLDGLWRSEAAVKIRRMIDGGGCHCWLNCTTYFALSETFSRSGIFSRLGAAGISRASSLYRGARGRAAAAASKVFVGLVSVLAVPYLLSVVLPALLRARINRAKLKRSRRP